MNLTQRLLGMQDSRSTRAEFSRGKNVYKGGATSAQRGGGPQYGRPSKAAIARRRATAKSKATRVNTFPRYH